MRFKGNFCRRIIIVKLIITIAAWWYYSLQTNPINITSPNPVQNGAVAVVAPSKAPNKHITKMITIVLRQFEDFENDVVPTLQSLLTLFPNIQIIIISDKTPYPAFEFTVPNTTLKNVKIVNLEVDLQTNSRDINPFSFIKTKYVLFIPDSMRISSRQVIQQMLVRIMKQPESNVAVPFSSTKFSSCQKLDLNLKEWSLKYENLKANGYAECDSVQGKHAVLVSTELLQDLPRPFMLPFPESLYLQLASRGIKVIIQL